MNLMLIVVPRYGAVLMTTCGFLLLATGCGYFVLLPEAPLVIHIEGSTLHFRFGWCYWLVVIAGNCYFQLLKLPISYIFQAACACYRVL